MKYSAIGLGSSDIFSLEKTKVLMPYNSITIDKPRDFWILFYPSFYNYFSKLVCTKVS